MAVKPPSTGTMAPVTNEDASFEASHNNAPESSDGSPNLPIGV